MELFGHGLVQFLDRLSHEPFGRFGQGQKERPGDSQEDDKGLGLEANVLPQIKRSYPDVGGTLPAAIAPPGHSGEQPSNTGRRTARNLLQLLVRGRHGSFDELGELVVLATE